MDKINNRHRFILPLLFLTFALGVCAPRPSIRATDTIPAPPTITPTSTPIDTTYGGCGYQWAYQDLPELTAQFDRAVKDMIPNSNSHVTGFGESCIGNDGQVIKFLAMETDFYVFITVESLDTYETFGNWIAQVMQVVNTLPADLVPGVRPGYVAFRFEKSASEGFGVNVPIQQYNESTSGKTGEELFRLFYTAP